MSSTSAEDASSQHEESEDDIEFVGVCRQLVFKSYKHNHPLLEQVQVVGCQFGSKLRLSKLRFSLTSLSRWESQEDVLSRTRDCISSPNT